MSKKSFNVSSMALNNKKQKYTVLEKLPIRFITPINCGGKKSSNCYDPLTDDLASPFRYNNTS